MWSVMSVPSQMFVEKGSVSKPVNHPWSEDEKVAAAEVEEVAAAGRLSAETLDCRPCYPWT
eukprot:438410-Pelagomonas_calceolata.AAC.1